MAGWAHKGVFRAMIVCAFVKYAFAIDCYVCSSKSDDNCDEEPNVSLLLIYNKVESGCTACEKEFKALGTVWSSVERSCSKTGSKDECSNILGYGSCSCTTTFCNNNNAISASGLMVTAMAAVVKLSSSLF